MGEEDVGPEKPESVTQEKTEAVEKTEEVTDEKQATQVKDSELAETDDKQIDESHGKDLVGDETDQANEIEANLKTEEDVKEEEKKENEEILEKEEAVEKVEDPTNLDEGMEDATDEKVTTESKDSGDEELHEDIDDKENIEVPVKDKLSKKRLRGKSSASKKAPHTQENIEEENEKEHLTPQEKKKKGLKPSSYENEEVKTPTTYASDRPVRERKSVERLVATIEKDSGKEFHVEKGRGTALKDIPNVAYKLSRKKTEETFKLLHTILFGRRGKAALVKNNISRFSGFVWHDDDEKQMNRVKEKLDKFVKEKLVEFCDVLDIPVSKVNMRKEDIITKLIEFLLEPHATTSELLAEKEQSSKGEKRKRSSKSTGESSITSKGSSKSQDKNKSSLKESGGNKGRQSASDDDSGEEEDEAHDGDNANGVLEKSENEMPEQSEGEDRDSESEESGEEKIKKKSGASKSSSKEKSGKKVVTKKETVPKVSPPAKNAPAKSPSSRTKKSLEITTKVSSGKKKETPVQKPSTPKQTAAKESTGKKVLKAKEKIEEKMKPTEDELKTAVCEILKEVDFNTATFTDILVLLAKRFKTDLTSRKAGIKLMIQDELTKLAEADDDDDDDDDAEEHEEGDSSKKEKIPAATDVKA